MCSALARRFEDSEQSLIKRSMQSALPQSRCAGAASSSKYCTGAYDHHQQRRAGRAVCRSAATASVPAEQQQQPQPFYQGSLFAEPDTAPSFVREQPQRTTAPSIRETGTLRPDPEWFPAWMKYRRRESNYIFWEDKFNRCSLEIPDSEKRWTVFSTLWFSMMELKFLCIPPALRFLWYIASRAVMFKVYDAHKAFVLWQCKVEAGLASKATGGKVTTFSKEMAFRRLHLQNSILGELLYIYNIYKTGRVHLLPPKKKPFQRPTFFWLF